MPNLEVGTENLTYLR